MKKSQLNRISPRKVQELIDQGKSIPASSFQVAKKLLKIKRPRMRSRAQYYKGVRHGSTIQLLVFQNCELLEKAKEISHLEAEKDFVLNAEGGGQVGLHRVDIIYFDEDRNRWQVFNVKGDFKGSIDSLSIWKKKHFERQYPYMTNPEDGEDYPVRYDFYVADQFGGRVFTKESELIEHLTS